MDNVRVAFTRENKRKFVETVIIRRFDECYYSQHTFGILIRRILCNLHFKRIISLLLL